VAVAAAGGESPADPAGIGAARHGATRSDAAWPGVGAARRAIFTRPLVVAAFARGTISP
jgi:hypothetical protein